MSKFKEPANIKQIGNIDNSSRLKIYIEDYAYSYLQQYTKDGNYNERLAFLVGEHIYDEDQDIILINGAICGVHTNRADGILNINQETWAQVHEQQAKYFPESKIMGLAQSQPGYGIYINEKYAAQFRNNFNELFQVFLVLDPIERICAFHVFDSQRENLNLIKGYFIYYKKNDAMNEYIIANKKNKKIKFEIADTNDQDNLNSKQNIKAKKNNNTDQRKIINMLAGLSAVLFLICFIMGAGLVQNEDRISKLENKIQIVSNLYKELDDSESVFALKQDKNKITVTPEIIKDIEPKEKNNKQEANQKENDFFAYDFQDDFDLEDDQVNKIQTGETKPEEQQEKKLEDQQEKKEKKIPESYVVKDGDSLGSISLKFFGDLSMVNKIMEINGMDDPDKIYVGKILKLPS